MKRDKIDYCPIVQLGGFHIFILLSMNSKCPFYVDTWSHWRPTCLELQSKWFSTFQSQSLCFIGKTLFTDFASSFFCEDHANFACIYFLHQFWFPSSFFCEDDAILLLLTLHQFLACAACTFICAFMLFSVAQNFSFYSCFEDLFSECCFLVHQFMHCRVTLLTSVRNLFMLLSTQCASSCRRLHFSPFVAVSRLTGGLLWNTLACPAIFPTMACKSSRSLLGDECLCILHV